ncbi:MAG TPA: hypothetical protein VG714_01435 [Acidobacteriaceae bacterium]|nr:hypothetical protein [Acidobacteriaceae bacterium]
MTNDTRYRVLNWAICGVLSAGVIAAAGCHGKSANAAEQQYSGDPAAANLANESQQPPAPIERNYPDAGADAGAPQGYPYTQPGYSSADQQSYADNGDYGDYYNDDLTDWQSNEPPPPLPQYDQPPAPYPNYIWTPGYWAWGPYGYTWVPGYWVAPPYVGALWTPGYWGFWNGAYRFHHGYWARHIGFYGGINYGFGYFGFGYDGGYWNGSNFYYNTAVTRVNRSTVRYVYVHNDGRRDQGPGRVSFNGGRGGVQVRPRAAEVTAMRGQRIGPMQTQVQVRDEASRNRQQSFSANHGRPAMAVAAQPLSRDRNLPAELPRAGEPGRGNARPETARPENARPGQIQRGQQQAVPRGGAAPEVARPGVQPRGQEMRPVRPQNEGRPQQPNAAPTPQRQSQPAPQQPQRFQRGAERGNFQQRQETRPQPQQRVTPQPQSRPAPPAQMHQEQPHGQHGPPPQARGPEQGHGGGNDHGGGHGDEHKR